MIDLLKGVRVLDLSRLLPGAYATSRLADFGADVVKVEQPPHGDYLRSMPPLKDGVGVLYMEHNRNKRSIELNLSTSDGYATFRRLVQWADVVVDGARPGALQRVRADYDSVARMKPATVYCAVSGFGQDGPYAALPAHGGQLEASVGLVDVGEDGPSTHSKGPRIFHSIQSAGAHAALAILAGLVRRDRTGEGCFLDVSCWDCGVAWGHASLATIANTGEDFLGPEPFGARSSCYKTSDGRWVTVGFIEPQFWEKFCIAVERNDLANASDPQMPAVWDQGEEGLRAQLEGIFSSRSQSSWVRLAAELSLPIAPVLTPRELLNNEHARARKIFAPSKHPDTGETVTIIAPPVKVSGSDFEVQLPSPRRGQHTQQIIAELDREPPTRSNKAAKSADS
jgi:crotonobetainyl-CoA:carnitine CoA-transferase CaiB-like acyl-CoA transferase